MSFPIWLRLVPVLTATLLGAGALGAAAPPSRLVTVLVLFHGQTRWDAWHGALGSPAPAGVTESAAGRAPVAGAASAPERAPESAPAVGSRLASEHAATTQSLDPATADRARGAASEAGLAIARAAAPVERLVTVRGGSVLARYDTALAGLLARVPPEALAEIAAMPAVRGVEAAPLAATALKDSVPGVGADRIVRELGMDGSLATIAVVDTGVDYTHATLGGPGDPEAYVAAAAAAERIDDRWQGRLLFPNDRVVGGYDFAGPIYSPDCSPPLEAQGACTATPRPDPDPLDTIGHGTGVAAVAAGGSAGAVGSGVAPGARLVALKIFGNSNLTNLLVDPIEWAIQANMGEGGRPRIDVMNLSLGQLYGARLLEQEGVIRRAVEAGVVVVASAGNHGNLPLVTSAPAVAPEALAVASHIAPGRHGWAARLVLADAEPLSFASGALYLQNWSPDPRRSVGAPVMHVGRACPAGPDGRPEDPLAADPRGAVALFEMAWGSGGPHCTVNRQARRLQDEGAVAALMGTGINLSVATSWDADPTADIPVWMVNGELETALKELAPAALGLRIELERAAVPGLDGALSTFSSRGPGRHGGLKPDLSAPGDGVFTAALGQGMRGLRLSGTSLAAPHAAGAAALVWHAARERQWQLSARDVAALLVTGADPTAVRQSAARLETPPLTRTGSGALDAFASASSRTLLRAGPLASLGLGHQALVEALTLERAVTVTNLDTVPRAYRLAAEHRLPGAEAGGLKVTAAPAVLELAPGETAEVRVQFQIRPDRLPEWPMAGGRQVGDGDALTAAELGGWLVVRDETQATAPVTQRVPFQLLARRASSVSGTWVQDEERPAPVTLSNASEHPGTAEAFVLGAVDPIDGHLPGAVDLTAVGVRALPDGQGNTVLEFLLHAREPYGHPLETVSQVEIDTDNDGTADYIAYTVDEESMVAGADRNGRVKVAVEPPGGSPFGTPTARFYAGCDLFSRWVILPLLAEDTGLTPSRLAFQYRVTRRSTVDRAPDGQPAVDHAPGNGGWLSFDARAALPWPAPAAARVAGMGTAQIETSGHAPLAVDLLLLFPNNPPGTTDAAILWRQPPPERAYVPYAHGGGSARQR